MSEYSREQLVRFAIAPADRIRVIRNGIDALGVSPDMLFEEQRALTYDRQALMYGRVVNKKARWNLCFDDHPQEPDYAAGKGRIVSFATVDRKSVV